VKPENIRFIPYQRSNTHMPFAALTALPWKTGKIVHKDCGAPFKRALQCEEVRLSAIQFCKKTSATYVNAPLAK